jgi:hypothetical protein
MFDSNILDVMIGIVFVFLLLSVATSWFIEFWAQILKLRSHHLKRYLIDWIDDGEAGKYVEKLYTGNVIGALYKKRQSGWLKDRQGPSFIGATDFVTAIFEKALMLEGGEAQGSYDKINAYLNTDAGFPEKLKTPILALMEEAVARAEKEEEKIVNARKAIEGWYDSVMSRAQGYYKRKVWLIGLLCALVLATLSNLDVITISRALWENQDLRLSVANSTISYVQTASDVGLMAVDEGTSADDPRAQALSAYRQIGNTLEEMDEANLPIFWKTTPLDEIPGDDPYLQELNLVLHNGSSLFSKILGILLTATAASFGSQIWFDLLKQLVNLRGTGPKPGEGREGKSAAAPAKTG